MVFSFVVMNVPPDQLLGTQRASQEVKDAQMFREKMGSVQDWMSRVKLPRDLKQKIRAYYAEVQAVVPNVTYMKICLYRMLYNMCICTYAIIYTRLDGLLSSMCDLTPACIC